MASNLMLASAAVGLIGGLTSGLLGVSPGGALVIFSALLLGSEQHLAQGLSLVAQIPPTSLSGIRSYRQGGHRVSRRWLIWLAVGFLVGGIAGALTAAATSSAALRWAYVVYLAILDAAMILGERRGPAAVDAPDNALRWDALFAVGALAGFSSGFLGIGGGLALTAGLATARVPRHQAQMASLVLSLIPTTIPAACVYGRHGWSPPWPAVCAVVLGLWIGTDIGARLANRAGEATLRRLAIGLVSAMLIYMTRAALTA